LFGLSIPTSTRELQTTTLSHPQFDVAYKSIQVLHPNQSPLDLENRNLHALWSCSFYRLDT